MSVINESGIDGGNRLDHSYTVRVINSDFTNLMLLPQQQIKITEDLGVTTTETSSISYNAIGQVVQTSAYLVERDPTGRKLNHTRNVSTVFEYDASGRNTGMTKTTTNNSASPAKILTEEIQIEYYADTGRMKTTVTDATEDYALGDGRTHKTRTVLEVSKNGYNRLNQMISYIKETREQKGDFSQANTVKITRENVKESVYTKNNQINYTNSDITFLAGALAAQNGEKLNYTQNVAVRIDEYKLGSQISKMYRVTKSYEGYEVSEEYVNMSYDKNGRVSESVNNFKEWTQGSGFHCYQTRTYSVDYTGPNGIETDRMSYFIKDTVEFMNVDTLDAGTGLFVSNNKLIRHEGQFTRKITRDCLLYTSPSPRDRTRSRMPSSA